MDASARYRRCVVVRGTPATTRALAERAVAGVNHVVHVDGRATARALLGSTVDAVVLDLHQGVDLDLIGLCHGCVRGGGALVLRLPDRPPPGDGSLFVHPFGPADVGRRTWDRLERCLRRHDTSPRPLAPSASATRGNIEQDRVVARLREVFAGPPGAIATLTADRGRGKSSALGLAVSRSGAGVVVTAQHPRSVGEVLRFAPHVPYVPPAELTQGGDYDVILVDEAAQLAVPVLQQLVLRHPRARIAFATTTRGYEGTGRGFVLRFLRWLETLARPATHLRLERPVRWDPGDPLERFVFDLLALDAEPAIEISSDGLTHAILDRDALAGDERLLREVFGLLVHAHYRTAPSDLQRLLDAPNLAVHALFAEGRVAAASLVAREGGLPPALCDAMYAGRERIRGHALADTLVVHAGHPEAGAFRMIRSVRIAAHPALRGRGVGRRLVEHVHRAYHADLFGTVFGATAEVIRFRRSLGYTLVRVGGSRGARTGEPAVVMVRPVSEAARRLVTSARRGLARELPAQLALLDADGGVPLAPTLRAELTRDLPAPEPLSADARDRIVREWACGPRPYEAAAHAVEALIAARPEGMAGLDPRGRALVEARVRDRRAWRRIAADLELGTVPATMRALRRAIRDGWLGPGDATCGPERS